MDMRPPPSLPAIVFCLPLLGCVSSEEKTRSVQLEKPRTTGGIILRDSPADWAERWSELLARREKHTATPSDRATEEHPPEVKPEQPAKIDVANWPAETGKLMDLPRMSRTELSELLDVLTRRLQTERGYRVPARDVAREVPVLPDELQDERVLAREDAEGGTAVLRFGYWRYLSRPPQLIVHAALLKDGILSSGPDLEVVEEMVTASLGAVLEMQKDLRPRDLEKKVIQLSYIDTKGAMSALKGMGFATFQVDSELPSGIDFQELPLVIELPSPNGEATGLVGAAAQVDQGKFGSTVVPTIASNMGSDVIASPSSRILVLFHPAHPEQFSRLKATLQEIIDRPARQVFVEGMILEISSIGLKELGIEWEFQEGKIDFNVGSPFVGLFNNVDSLNFLAQKSLDLPTDWAARIRALIVDGKAEILSRPSVLTLNNRQATIRIGQDIPIVTSQEGLQGGASKIAFDFEYLALGILLNIRPRISHDGSEVSLMVDTMVSSRVPGTDVQIVDEDGQVLASAPVVDSRRVQTYARVQNNTPFIIGGLVSRNRTTIHNKIPLLGDIPWLGRLFRSESYAEVRREVIIVLTPYVVPEELYLSRALPKGERVDLRDQELFRDSPRIRMEDIADVSFLYRNERFRTYRDLARKAVRENFRLAEEPPFSLFAEKHLPGEEVLVERITYGVLKRHRAGERIQASRIVVLTSRRTGGYDVEFLEHVLRVRQVGEDYESFFTDHPDKALALTFHDLREATGGESLASEPVPEMSIVDCASREEWGRLMWELNQPGNDGRTRYTILLHDDEDVRRLKLAFMVKGALLINRGGRKVSLFNFIPGRVIEIPEPMEGSPRIIDSEVARYFFHSVHYYARTIQIIEAALLRLDHELRRPEFQLLLEDVQLPPLERKH
ncbi:MAG: hypothetical protein O6952_04735 [Planctomycetota bacterium]|nr:hypothetical protein [Planctomycetota bacterium]